MLFTRSRRNRRRCQRSSFNSAQIEVLEDRILLTGNVKAVFSGNDLIVEGDSGDNEIALAVIDGNLVVHGMNGTTINSAESFVAIAGSATIQNDLRISMGSGDDVVIIGSGIHVNGDVTIDTGDGDDTVSMNSDSRPVPALTDHHHSELSISINGENVVIPSEIGIGPNGLLGFMHTHDGEESGRIHIEPNPDPPTESQTVGDFFDLWRTNAGNPGNNPDAVFSANEILGNVVDDDHVIRMLVNGRPNSEFDNYVFRDGDELEIIFEDRTDQNSLPALPSGSLVIDDDLTILTGQGDDTILLTGITVGDDLRIDSGTGQDVVKVADSTIGDNVWAGASNGNNVIAVVGTTVGDTGSIFTGPGDDILGVDDFGIQTDSGTGQDEILNFRFQIDALDEIVAAEDRVGELVNPVAVDDLYTIAADEDTLTVDVLDGLLANDILTMVGEPHLTLLDDSQLDGSVTLNADGSFVYTPNIDFSGTDTFTYSLTNDLGGSAVGTVEITVAELSLDLDLSANDTIQSNGTLLTRDDMFHIEGITAPNAIIEIDRDGDGQFDDGTVDADATGFFSIDVTLIHDTTNFGANVLEIRSSSAVSNKTQSVFVDVHLAVGTVVRFNSSQGAYDIELFDADAPNTVANFLNYVDSGRYEYTIIHRSVSDFIIQGGGFTFDELAIPQVAPVVTDPPILNEFNPANSNLRGTLSMAQGPDINSGTSQWFVNLDDDNDFLDAIPHTVFGRVIGTGMEIADAINALSTFELFEFFNEGALTDVPLDGYARSSIGLNGTVSIDIDIDPKIVIGTDTAFTSSIRGPGSHIRIDGELFTVVSIESNTQLTIDVEHPSGVTDVSVSIENAPNESDYVIFSDISKILEP